MIIIMIIIITIIIIIIWFIGSLLKNIIIIESVSLKLDIVSCLYITYQRRII